MKNIGEITTRTLHWGFAIFVIAMMALGFYMANSQYNLDLYQWHKSMGVIFFAVIWFRVYSRIRYPWTSSSLGTPIEKIVYIVHGLLFYLLLIMPITGLLSSAFSGFSVHLFDFTIFPENYNEAGHIVPINSKAYELFKVSHRISSYLLGGLISLHVLAALKHHFINKDNTLRRMLLGNENRK